MARARASVVAALEPAAQARVSVPGTVAPVAEQPALVSPAERQERPAQPGRAPVLPGQSQGRPVQVLGPAPVAAQALPERRRFSRGWADC
jgi:hypothetical protein